MRKTIGEWRKQEGMVTESVKWRLKRFAFDPNEHMLEWRSSWRALGHVCFWVGPNWLETKIFNFSFHLTQELLQYIYSSVLSFKVRTHLKKPWSVKCTKFYDKWCGWTEKLWQLFFFFFWIAKQTLLSHSTFHKKWQAGRSKYKIRKA
jgi:TRAP-type mannitol/chloroaromatic compound transport system permease small subunit